MQEEWGGSLCAWRIPVQCYSHNMTMMAYIKSHRANNPLLHAIPKQKPVLKSGAMRQHRHSCMPAQSVQRGKQRGSSELGCTRVLTGTRRLPWAPRAFLKPWQPARGALAFQPRESHAGSLSGTRELQGVLGVIVFSRTLRLIVPWWATRRTVGMDALAVLSLGSLIHLSKVRSHILLTFMAELGTLSFVSWYLTAKGVPLKPSLASTYCYTLNSFI